MAKLSSIGRKGIGQDKGRELIFSHTNTINKNKPGFKKKKKRQKEEKKENQERQKTDRQKAYYAVQDKPLQPLFPNHSTAQKLFSIEILEPLLQKDAKTRYKCR